MISLVDVSRVWFKARVGADWDEVHRNDGFCSYVLLDNAPDTLVVPDMLDDPIFKTNVLVTGEPFIRFYAGTAITVEGIKIGTICVLGLQPRHNFGIKEMDILMDIASILSNLITERRRKVMRIERELADLTVNVLKTIKRPLTELSHVHGDLQRIGKLNQLLIKTDSPDSSSTYVCEELTTSVQQFQGKLKTMDDYLQLSLKAIEDFACDNHTINNRATQVKMSTCDIVQIINQVKPILSRVLKSTAVLDTLCDEPLLSFQTEVLQCSTWYSYPDLVSLALCHCIGFPPNHCTFVSMSLAKHSMRREAIPLESVVKHINSDCCAVDFAAADRVATNQGMVTVAGQFDIIFRYQVACRLLLESDDLQFLESVMEDHTVTSLTSILSWLGGTVFIDLDGAVSNEDSSVFSSNDSGTEVLRSDLIVRLRLPFRGIAARSALVNATKRNDHTVSSKISRTSTTENAASASVHSHQTTPSVSIGHNIPSIDEKDMSTSASMTESVSLWVRGLMHGLSSTFTGKTIKGSKIHPIPVPGDSIEAPVN